jgi:hypothetical protein
MMKKGDIIKCIKSGNYKKLKVDNSYLVAETYGSDIYVISEPVYTGKENGTWFTTNVLPFSRLKIDNFYDYFEKI